MKCGSILRFPDIDVIHFFKYVEELSLCLLLYNRSLLPIYFRCGLENDNFCIKYHCPIMKWSGGWGRSSN